MRKQAKADNVIRVDFRTGKIGRPERMSGTMSGTSRHVVSWNGPRTRAEWRGYFDFCMENDLDPGKLPAWFRG